MRGFVKGLFLFTLGLLIGATLMDRLKGRVSDQTRRMVVMTDVLHAQDLASRGNLAGAREAFVRAILLHPDSFKAHLDFGMFYECVGEWDSARGQFERAIESYPGADDVDLFAPLPEDLAQAHARLGRAAAKLGDAETARQAFAQAATIQATRLPRGVKNDLDTPDKWMTFLARTDRRCIAGAQTR
jgi:tetratricopeptide (TPR) repeat protein